MSNIILRRATMEHLSRLEELEQQCFSDPWSRESLTYSLQDEESLWLVAEDESGTVQGYAGSRMILDEADIMNVAVAPSARNQGIGTIVLSGLLRELDCRRVRAVTLEVRVSNTPARTLYDHLGFTQVGRRPNYYDAPKEDALILRREGKEALV